MSSTFPWQSGSVQSLGYQLSGQGPQLTNGSAVLLNTVFNNTGVSGGPATYASVQLLSSQSGYGASLAAGNYLEFYMVPSLDGVTYQDANAAGAVLPAGSFRGIFLVVTSGNSQACLGIEGIPLMPTNYKGYIKNVLGQTLTSGWGISLNAYQGAAQP